MKKCNVIPRTDKQAFHLKSPKKFQCFSSARRTVKFI